MRSYNLNRVITVRERIYEDAFYGLVGITPDKDVLEDLTKDLLAILPDGCGAPSVYKSIEHLAGQPVKDYELYDLAWRLAGNIDSLKAHVPVKPWMGQPVEEWMPLQIIDSEDKWCLNKKTERNELYYCYTMRIMAGSAAPMIIKKIWSKKFVTAMLVREIGFSAPWNKLPFQNRAELVSLRILGRFDSETCKNGKPNFDKIKCSPGCLTWNKSILTMRQRFSLEEVKRDKDAFTCMENYPVNEVPCFACPRGYESCQAACHPRDYYADVCPICEKQNWFDPNQSTTYCISCASQRGQVR